MKKFSIGYRTVKTAIGVIGAIAIAETLDLQFFTAAGILTILSIQPTRKKSLHAVWTRVLGSLIALGYAYLLLELVDYNPIMLGLLFIFLIPTLVSFHSSEAFVSSAVILLHIYTVADFTMELFINELLIMMIGFGMGLAVNMYMPDIEEKLNDNRLKIEKNFRKILKEIARYLYNGEAIWDGQELIETGKLLNSAKALAFQDVENHLSRKENFYYVYFDMREKQLEIIERILPKITTLPVLPVQASIVAEFMEELSRNVHSGNTAYIFREKLAKVKQQFAEMTLPEDHQTFLAMASLYQFIEEMDAYLVIKQSFVMIESKIK